MKLYWTVGKDEKTWIEYNDSIDVYDIKLPDMIDGDYVVGGNITNPYLIRKEDYVYKNGIYKPSAIRDYRGITYITKWELADDI